MTYQKLMTAETNNLQDILTFQNKAFAAHNSAGLEFNKLCAAIADEHQANSSNREAHAALFAGCAVIQKYSRHVKFDVKEQRDLEIQNAISS